MITRGWMIDSLLVLLSHEKTVLSVLDSDENIGTACPRLFTENHVKESVSKIIVISHLAIEDLSS